MAPCMRYREYQVTETPEWNETPYPEEGETLYRCKGAIAERMGRGLRSQAISENG